MKESKLNKEFVVKYSDLGHRLFRQNNGTGWTGKVFRAPGEYYLAPGDILIRQARPLHAGLVKGSSDLIGWTVTEITPEMVGKSFPIFSAVEVKTGRLKATKEQAAFLEYIKSINGISVLAYKFNDIIEEIKQWKKRNQ